MQQTSEEVGYGRMAWHAKHTARETPPVVPPEFKTHHGVCATLRAQTPLFLRRYAWHPAPQAEFKVNADYPEGGWYYFLHYRCVCVCACVCVGCAYAVCVCLCTGVLVSAGAWREETEGV
mgnify:CR=1 FL=1